MHKNIINYIQYTNFNFFCDYFNIKVYVEKHYWQNAICYSFILNIYPGEHCTLYIVYTVHCTLYIVHCTLYTIYYTLYIVQCNVPCTMYSILHCTGTLFTMHCTLYVVQYTLYSVHCTLCCTLYIVNSVPLIYLLSFSFCS